MSYQPSPWDWIVFVALQIQCGLFLLLATCWLPISDWLMHRRLRKEQAWKWRRRRPLPKIEHVARSRWHGRN